MIPSVLPLGISFKHSLESHQIFNSIVKTCVEIVKSIDGYEALKTNPELILLVCNVVEKYIPNNKYKLDKKEVVVIVFDTVFKLTDEEMENLRKQVQFNYDNNRIKAPTFWGIVKTFFTRVFHF